jgi:cytosine/adenosine deaminase-related metal-dependent hydrolase
MKNSFHRLGVFFLVALMVSCAGRPLSVNDRVPARVELPKAHLTLVGAVPNRFLFKGSRASGARLGAVIIEDGIIKDVRAIAEDQIKDLPPPVVTLKRKDESNYDVIYPALVNLHNHTKQNVLGLWADAKGQFENRFEWRAWSNYQASVSQNMNPWISFDPVVSCAAFRWSELSALALGTVYLQGPSSCVSGFGIHRVEDASSFRQSVRVPRKLNVQAPTDIIYPNEMTFVWNTVYPRMQQLSGETELERVLSKTSYEEGFKSIIHEFCPSLREQIKNVNGTEELKTLSNQATLKTSCLSEDQLPKGFIRYTYFIHKTIAGKKRYISGDSSGADENADETEGDEHALITAPSDPQKGIPTAIIAHLAEGSRTDKYNRHELTLLRVLGLDVRGMNFIHGVGIDFAGYQHMAKKGIGLVWSPFSNLLLYGETADILAAHRARVRIALGSDWTPTGSKSVLEELKIARAYIQKNKLSRVFNDEYLYRMVTENSAQLLNHFESDPNDGYNGIGTVAPGAMGSILVLRRNHSNVYTNLVTADYGDVNLVVVDGRPQYGTRSYLEQYASATGASVEGEPLSRFYLGYPEAGKIAFLKESEKPAKSLQRDHVVSLARQARELALQSADQCGFSEEKLLVHQSSAEPAVRALERDSGLNLDRYDDIQRFLALKLTTQSRNAIDPSKGDEKFAVKAMAPLLSCNDPKYLERLNAFVSAEIDANWASKAERRTQQRHGRVPEKMSADYRL